MRLVYDVDDLLRRYRDEPKPPEGEIVVLTGVGRHDAYNPSAPIPDGSHPFIYARVEPRDDEFSSWSMPFRQDGAGSWDLEEDLPIFFLQDPFTCVIHGALVVGGVRVVAKVRERVIFRTVFLRGQSPAGLEEFAQGPLYMKDVRLVELDDGAVGVFTRPLGGAAGRGQIGYTEVPGLEALTTQTMGAAPMLETQPIADHWWGANHVYALGGDFLGILAHIAKLEGNDRHYYPIAFVFDRRKRTIVDGPAIIAERSCFPSYTAKRPELRDVVFPSWIDRERGMLLAGLSDSAIGLINVGDPFKRWGHE